jgi:hypothetical protein
VPTNFWLSKDEPFGHADCSGDKHASSATAAIGVTSALTKLDEELADDAAA